MGFGCNAAGVVSAKIIDSDRDRLIAILTNSFVPCNGRFPALIILASLFIAGAGLYSSLVTAVVVLFAIILSVTMTLLISNILSRTLLKGMPSDFILELPPYRKPQIAKVFIRSIFDRTLFVLGRAVTVAAPAGIAIWLLQNTYFGGISILGNISQFLDPFGKQLGMDGVILTAFIIGMPANEIVIPIVLMCYSGNSSLDNISNISSVGRLLADNGWNTVTAICTMLFFLNHFPCSTTTLTIYKETRSIKWTLISFLLPTIVGIVICFCVSHIFTFLQ